MRLGQLSALIKVEGTRLNSGKFSTYVQPLASICAVDFGYIPRSDRKSKLSRGLDQDRHPRRSATSRPETAAVRLSRHSRGAFAFFGHDLAPEIDFQAITVGRFAGLSDCHHHTAPIRIAAGDRSLDKGGVGDGKRDPLRADWSDLRASDVDANEFLGTFAIAHHLKARDPAADRRACDETRRGVCRLLSKSKGDARPCRWRREEACRSSKYRYPR